MNETTCWRELLDEEARIFEDPIQRCSLPLERLTEEFDVTDPAHSGDWFFAWGSEFVYFPRWEDGRAVVAKAPRNPEHGRSNSYRDTGPCEQRNEERKEDE